MDLSFPRHWGLDYLLIGSEQWRRESEARFLRRTYEVLDLWNASRVLERIAREDERFFRQLADDVIGRSYHYAQPQGSYEARRLGEQRLEELTQRLGSALSEMGAPPIFASFYICRRRRDVGAAASLADPWRDVREAIDAAKRAPRGYVTVEAVTAAGDPVPHHRLEILFADGDVRTLSTDSAGRLHVESIPQGSCHIRVPGLDGSAWSPAEGPDASCIDRGRKQCHVVQKGEGLSRIAKQYGLHSWKQLWDAPENEALRKKRKNPNMLHPGDEVVVPAIEIREIVRPTDETHRIVVAKPRAVMALLNTHMLEDPGNIGTHWQDGSSRIAAGTPFYRDDTSMGLRVDELFAQVPMVLIAPAGSGQSEGSPPTDAHPPASARLA